MEIFEQEFESLYRSENGRPGKSIRLMVGLLMLKHIRNVSDENVVEQWSENNYCQYFCGEQSFVPGVPYEASELVHFRKRIGEKDDCKVKTIAGILARELERSLLPLSKHQNQLDLFKQVLIQIKSSKNKIYSIHEPEVCGISKGKEYKKYEFGNKASFAKTDSGVIVGAMVFRNECDGHTLPLQLEQVERLTGKPPKKVKVDPGYKGKSKIGETEILIPSTPKKSDSYYQRKKSSNAHQKRAAIEPIIGHMKQGHRLGCNFYKGIVGDNINIMLAVAAFNFKRMMNK